ncbi:clustered mitochondria protein-like isoform X7 [Glycine max]|uniref:clustered mitochondria protein-like isoform X7 n=1 Tax=Glycine max TaxID=3847 RepID=UPI001B354E73|nr:clustered mitochondria protein-like isoform X7 [Glycine max]
MCRWANSMTRVLAHKYDLNSTAPFQTSDILDLHPIVKHSIPVSAEAKGLVETGKLQFAEEMLNEAYRLHFIFRGTLSSTTGYWSNASGGCQLLPHLAWNKDTQRWKVSSMLPSDLCNQYKIGPKITGMKGA